jgi:Ca2+-binding RTX toxin-like protein
MAIKFGTNHGDLINGTALADKIFGLDGNDILKGGLGNDILKGDSGNDTLYGEAGNDVLDGGSGKNVLVGGDGNDRFIAGHGNDTIFGGNGAHDTIDFTGLAAPNQFGLGSVLDLSLGNYGVGSVQGHVTGVADAIGTNFIDVLNGDGHPNTLSGGLGNDILEGRGGKDVLIGGAGKDVFVYSHVSDSGPAAATRDVIMDFQQGKDQISLQNIDADLSTPADDAFTFIPGSNVIGDLGSHQVGYFKDVAHNVTMVHGEPIDHPDQMFTIELKGLFDLTAKDFVL